MGGLRGRESLAAADTIDWLLEGDPAVVWQVERDLLVRPRRVWRCTRERVATEGWGQRLMAHRASDGTWGGGLYNPKWTSTFYTLRLLTHLGLPPQDPDATASCTLLLDNGVSHDGGVRLWSSPATDTCVTAMLLSMACYFEMAGDARTDRMVRFLLGEQMKDGGWNCRYRRKGATHASFHTTISVLEGLAAYSASPRTRRDVEAAQAEGRTFFLKHDLYRSSSTGNVVKSAFSKLSFPPRWYFDVLRGLEYFRSIAADRDERLEDAIAVLRGKRRADGRWPAQNRHPGQTFFELERAGQPSRMNTLRALRVLGWWDDAA